MGEQAALGKGGLLTPAPSPGGRESRCPRKVIPLGRWGCRLRISCFQSLHSKITSLGDTWSPPIRAPSGQLENITLDGTGKHSRPGTKIPDSWSQPCPWCTQSQFPRTVYLPLGLSFLASNMGGRTASPPPTSQGCWMREAL